MILDLSAASYNRLRKTFINTSTANSKNARSFCIYFKIFLRYIHRQVIHTIVARNRLDKLKCTGDAIAIGGVLLFLIASTQVAMLLTAVIILEKEYGTREA